MRAVDNGRGGHYNSTLEQGQCFVLTVLTLPQTAPETMSNVGHSRAAIGQSEGRCPLTCTGHPPCRTPPGAKLTKNNCFNMNNIYCMICHRIDSEMANNRIDHFSQVCQSEMKFDLRHF